MKLARIALCGLFTLIFCAAPALAGEKQPLRIGVIESMTGVASEDGLNAIRALTMAQEDLLRERNIAVELLVQDDASSSKGAVSAFQQLALDGVSAIVGPTWDFTINAVIPLAASSRIPLLVTTVFPEALTLREGRGFATSLTLPLEDEAGAFEGFLEERASRALTIVYAGNAWGEVQREVYRARASRRSIAIAGEFRVEGMDNNELGSIILKIKERKADTLVLLLNRADIDTFARRAREIKLGAAIFASKNAYDAYRLAEDSREHLDGICFPYPKALLARGSNRFVERFNERWQTTPRIYADNSYDVLFLLAESLCAQTTKERAACNGKPAPSYRAPLNEYTNNGKTYTPEEGTGTFCIRGHDVVPMRAYQEEQSNGHSF